MRAKGGAAAVTVSECMVHPQTDGSHAYHLGESILNSLACTTYTADAIRRHGAIPSIELSHSGMYSGTYMTDKTKQHGMAQWGSSACTRPGGMAVGELGRDMIGEIVAAYGHAAGLAGCECAIHLAQEGKTVRLVEMRSELAPDANVRHRPLMLKQMEELGDNLTICTGHKALKVTTEGVICQDQGGKEVLVSGRSVICALGQRSRSAVVDELRDAAPFVRVIGDAAKVSTITNAVYWGYYAALDI